MTETAVGKYRYKGYEQTPSVEVVCVMLPGQPEYDGGVPGISFRLLKRRKRTTYFFVCNSVEEFFRADRFSNLERVP